MTKLGIIDSVKLGTLNFDANQFNIPKRVKVLTSVPKFVYEKVNGESVKTETISKIACTVLDDDMYKLLEDAGMDTSVIQPMTLEVIDEGIDKVFPMVKDKDNNLLNDSVVELIGTNVRLKWTKNGNNGSWKGVKLVCTGMKLITG